jgi:outer membrane assembly lipoprotein YfiO
MSLRALNVLGAALVLLAAGCRTRIDLSLYPNNNALFQASLAALNDGRKAFAVQGFERLTLTLGARDTLLARSTYYLAVAYSRQKEHIRAGDAFARIPTLFASDTLADDALLAAAREYRKLWPDPELDFSYGKAAESTLQRLLRNYPSSPLVPEVFSELQSLEEDFATKDFNVGMGYFRKRLYHSAIEYFRDVAEQFPSTKTARLARLQIVKSFQRLGAGWIADIDAECVVMRQLYRDDPEVLDLCGARLTGGGGNPGTDAKRG